ncbi:MAG TPA: penicillin-binding protein 1C [Candidatus Binataceae bacterium]|nr:penicillin-binding protein 1C [Candidatus Binataceae bacterium]
MRRRGAYAGALAAAGLLAVAGLLAAISSLRTAPPSFDAVRARWRPSDAQLLDRHGEPIHELRVDAHGRRLAWTPLAAISPALRKAVIAAEDRRFLRHHGVDFAALAAATAGWLAGRPSRGASTLTMQLAAMLDPRLARAGTRRHTVTQKLLQMLAAFALERRWSKSQILEAYLNLVTYRSEIEGVGAAARVMFGKAPDGIDGAEAVVLAALIKAPNARAAALERRAEALRLAMSRRSPASDVPGGRAVSSAQVTSAQVTSAIDRALVTRPRDFTRVTLAPRVAEQLLRDGRLTAQSTLDRDLQTFALDALRRHVAEVHDRNVDDGAVVVVENSTGEVWAYVGGTGALSSAPYVDGVRAMRQPGSALKPFLYALALERRLLTPASLLADTPLELPEQRGLYRPLDYDREFRGLVSMRVALASSLNVPAVRTIDMVGVEAFTGQLRALGFEGIVEQGDYYGAALALGSADVRLWDLVNAYRALANGGRYCAMRLMNDRAAEPTRQIYSPATAFLVSDILADRASRAATFGLENALATRFWSAVKTGTSKDMRDNWCVGYSARFTVGVWVGNFSGAAMHDVTGITGAAPVWLDLMNYLDQRFGGGAIAKPAGVTARMVEFPNAVEPARKEWFIAGTEPNRQAASLDDTPRILSPAPDTVIAFDPDIPSSRQRVAFVASADAGGGSLWTLDHKTLGPANGVMLWTPSPGVHTLALADARGRTLDTTTFKVRGGTDARLRGLGK